MDAFLIAWFIKSTYVNNKNNKKHHLVLQIRCKLLLGWLSDGVSTGIPEHAHREPRRAAKQHGSVLRTAEAIRNNDAILRQRVPNCIFTAARYGSRAMRLLIVDRP